MYRPFFQVFTWTLLSLFSFANIYSAAQENEPPQKKRRIESPQENKKNEQKQTEEAAIFLKKFQERCAQLVKYQNAPEHKQKQLFQAYFGKYQSTTPTELAESLCCFLPYTNQAEVFIEVTTLLKKLPANQLLLTLHSIRHLLKRFPEPSLLEDLLQSKVIPHVLSANEIRIRELSETLKEIKSPAFTTHKAQQKNTLSALSNKITQGIKTIDELTEFLQSLAACDEEDQALFIDKNLSLFFKETPEDKEDEFCCLLLLHLKKVLANTTSRATCGYIAKVVAQIGFTNHLNIEQGVIAKLAFLLTKQPFLMPLTTNIRDTITNYIDLFTKQIEVNRDWLTPCQNKEEIPAIQKKQTENFFKLFELTKKFPDEAFVKKFSTASTATLFIQQGKTFLLKRGIAMPYSYAVFFSQGSKYYQKILPNAQIVFLKNLQTRSTKTKKTLLCPRTLWADIRNTTVAIEYLKTIRPIEEKKQTRCLIHDNNAESIEECMEQYKTATKLEEPFFVALMKHIARFSPNNIFKILQSKLFKTVIPNVGYAGTIAPDFYELLKKLTTEERYTILKDDEFLGNYLTNYAAGPWIIKAIEILPDHLQVKVFQELFSTILEIEDEVCERLEKTMAPENLCLILQTIENLGLEHQVKLFTSNKKIIYRLIKDSEEELTNQTIKNLLENLVKNTTVNLPTKELEQELADIFLSFLLPLLEKPFCEKTENEYKLFTQIPQDLPEKCKYYIVKDLLSACIDLITSTGIPNATEWIHQHYVLNQLFTFLEKSENYLLAENLFTRFQKNELWTQVHHAIQNFYLPTLIREGAKEMLAETGMIKNQSDYQNPEILSKLKELEKKLTSCSTKLFDLHKKIINNPTALPALQNNSQTQNYEKLV